jgi:hypothetical protein
LPDLDINSDITLGTQYFKSRHPLEQGNTQSMSLCSPN